MMMHSMNLADMRALSNQLPIPFPRSPQVDRLDDYVNKNTIPEESLSDEGENINDLVDESPEITDEPAKVDIVKSKSINPSKNIYFKHKEGVPPLSKKRQSKSSFNKLLTHSSKKISSGFMRLQTETSETFSKSNLLKALSIYEPENTELNVEESLVIHYISIVIRLLKLSDGMKAIHEYRKKKGLSKRANAHLYKLEGLLALLSDKKEYDEAKKCFHESLKLFHKINSAKGKAICRLALVRVQCESEHKNNVEKTSTKQLISIAEKAQQQFERIDYERGAKRAECYVKMLKNKLLSETNNIASTFVKLRTLKQSNTPNKTDKLHLQDTVLNDEDILLFTEIIENDEFKLGIERRHGS